MRVARIRHHTATVTITTHAASTANTSRVVVSVPVARPCTTANGQHTYASQCTRRQARGPMRFRSKLVAINASTRSNATAPKPSHNGRYADANGMTASFHPIGANPSSTTVAMCATMNTTARIDTLRWRNVVAKRGHRSLIQRTLVTIPSSTLAVSSSRLTMPVPRERYQRVDAVLIASVPVTRQPTSVQEPRVRVWGWIGGLVDGGLVGCVGVGRGDAGKPFAAGCVDGVVAGGAVLTVAGELVGDEAPPGSAFAAYTENAPASPTAVTTIHRVTRDTRRSPPSRG